MSNAGNFQSLVLAEPERSAFLEEIRGQVSAKNYERIESMINAIEQLLRLICQSRITMARLRRWALGTSTEKTKALYPPPADTAPGGESKPGRKRKGHGRNGARHYTGACRVRVPHPSVQAGAICPECQKGKCRAWRAAVSIHVRAQPPISALIHEMESLRCDLCGQIFTAPTPPEAGTQKYDPSVGVMVSVLRYGSGMPFYRLERLQRSLGVPLPAATQWELVAETAQAVEPIFEQLIDVAAQAQSLSNDDTSMRVDALRREIKAEKDPERTGIFTTGIVSGGQDPPIALFFTGRRHGGENLNEVLRRRQGHLPTPLQMCDGLSRNEPREYVTLLGNCLVHARRGFVDVSSDFPDECRHVLERVRDIYRLDAQTKEQNLSPDQRLLFHQTHSQPVMDQLQKWLQEQIDQKKVEPNSGLGRAINYMLKRWEPLTLFLRQAGAPLDNNVVERALKMAILHRRNSLSYKTQRGAQVGDMFMSVIHTCGLSGLNPFDYLSALVANAKSVRAQPAAWLPWNYREALAKQTHIS